MCVCLRDHTGARACVCVQILKNASGEASPYFQAANGKQPPGSVGLPQLEKCAEGARARAALQRPLGEKKAKLNKLSAAKTKQVFLVSGSLESRLALTDSRSPLLRPRLQMLRNLDSESERE